MAASDRHGRVAEVIAGLLGPLLTPMGLVVEDVAVTPAGKRRLVRISVDRDTGALPPQDDSSPVPPISLDEVAEAARVIDAALDEREPFGDAPYVLEVTSPGVQRPLTEPRHYRRNVGRLVELSLREGTIVAGRLVAAGPAQLTVAGADDVRRVLELADVARGRVQVEFARADESADDLAEDPDEDLADGLAEDAAPGEPAEDEEF
ncbi:MAG: ribosome maturation factor RimP [Austwickia sp.]|jgi:ribosome maturation factor RimP|nr:MAG: ribosome maturation factor RimP [Austwickia sp.]